jgi:hypothetical protein
MTTRPIWSRPPRWFSCAALVGARLAPLVATWLLPLLAALLAPAVAVAEEPTLEQIEYHPAELPPDGARTRTIVVGVALTAGWYGAAVGTSYLWPDAPNSKELRLPVVGPWMALGNVGCGDREPDCSTGTVIARTVLGVVSGVGQAGGLFAILEGLLMDTGSANAAAPAAAGSPTALGERALGPLGPVASWSAAPVMLEDGAGIELFGRF